MKVSVDITETQLKRPESFLNVSLSIDQLLIDKYYLVVFKTHTEAPECFLTTAKDFFTEKTIIEYWLAKNGTVFEAGHVSSICLVKVVGYSQQGFPVAMRSDGEKRPLAEFPEELLPLLTKH